MWNEDEDSLFVHHDILLDTFPLCVEWIGYDPGSESQRGNLVAVGSMQPDVRQLRPIRRLIAGANCLIAD